MPKFSDRFKQLRTERRLSQQNLADQLSEQVFTDLIQLLFDEKIITEREGNLILATASDDVLGEDAAAIRSRILRSLLLRLDRKGN